MNTLKKCILLMVLTLNLMPYMQDGNLKWTTTDAAAQKYYTEEVITAGVEWLCGNNDYKYNSDFFFKSNKKCEDIGELCIVQTGIPCSILLKTTAKNINLPSPACIFWVTSALTGLSPYTLETEYKAHGVISSLDFNDAFEYLESKEVTVSNGVNNASELLCEMKDCDKGLVMGWDTGEPTLNDSSINIAHIILYFGLIREWGSNITKAMLFDNSTPNADTGDFITGRDDINEIDYKKVNRIVR